MAERAPKSIVDAAGGLGAALEGAFTAVRDLQIRVAAIESRLVATDEYVDSTVEDRIADLERRMIAVEDCR